MPDLDPTEPRPDMGHDLPEPDAVTPTYPVFYDASRRRWPWFVRGGFIVILLASAGVLLLVVSLVARPLMPPTMLPKLAVARDVGNLEPILNHYQRARLAFLQEKEKAALRQAEERRRRRRLEGQRRAAAFLRHVAPRPPSVLVRAGAPAPPVGPAPVPANPAPVVAGFYVNWDETSRASLHRNIGALTHFIPEWLHLKPAGTNYADPNPDIRPFIDAREQSLDVQDVTPFVRRNALPIVPLINNYTEPVGAEEGAGDWDTTAVHDVVSDPQARANVVRRLRDWLVANQMQGINIDFEEVDTDDRQGLVEFMKELYAALHPLGLLVTQDVQLDSSAFDVPNLAKWCDWIVPMFYDQHAGGTLPGPVAAVDWTQRDLSRLLKSVPAGKIVMGVGNHGYDWPAGRTNASDLTYQGAIDTARESQPDAVIHLDRRSLNPTFTYSEDETAANGVTRSVKHVVWMQDAVSVYDQLLPTRSDHIRGAALWYLGAEDPSIWTFLNKNAWAGDWPALVDEGALDTISYGGQAEIDFEGEGELLQPLSPPSVGNRQVVRDSRTGFITREWYPIDPASGLPQWPSSYVVRRSGGTDNNVNKQIVLTFDDGPDPTWTPQILDILERYHVPAAFFVVGQLAEDQPGLIAREWRDGDLIGNHSWSHPDLFRLSLPNQRLQITTTQRVIQAITGHSTILFRPPYGGDTEPQTGREVEPMQIAAGLGYITVGEINDPQDWRLFNYKPGTQALDYRSPRSAGDIVRSVVVNRSAGSIVLLHDSGGPRLNTVEALPQIIEQLRADGYTFVDLSKLVGIPRTALMPVVTGSDTLLVGADRYVFDVSYTVQLTLTTLFMLSIVLGISRVVLFVGLAFIQRHREKRRVFRPAFRPRVSVVIAAFNEDRVIADTVRAVLDSSYPDLEVVVVDDGSVDQTADVVRRQFGALPNVRLIRRRNGGKASALDRGIAASNGEIVVALDADTLFGPETISRLVRHFGDERIGAVSGNVRVGNARGLLTRWQALEYITSQNFDRRGYDLLNCITVVPGAVGAVRRSAILAVGGYTSDTLAEDTDLTWKLRRAGWRIVNDSAAMAYTEAPETLGSLARQRFRWAFGTLQCLWKHRGAIGQHGAFGWLALPSLWLYQILFPAVSPFMDIAMVWSIMAGNFVQFGAFYLLMFGVELLAATTAVSMDRGNPRLLPWLFFQRFVYRQLMYYVILKSIVFAVRGSAVGWNKIERTGHARIESKPA